jgi:hypothetical protein
MSNEWFMLCSKDFIRIGRGRNSISLLMKKTKNRIEKLAQIFSWETPKKKNIEQIMKVKQVQNIELWCILI